MSEENFKDLLEHSEAVANKLWKNKEDEIWKIVRKSKLTKKDVVKLDNLVKKGIAREHGL